VEGSISIKQINNMIDTVTGVNCRLCDIVSHINKQKTDSKAKLLPYLGGRSYMELMILKAEKNKKEKEEKLKYRRLKKHNQNLH
jgi:hypothetical protein